MIRTGCHERSRLLQHVQAVIFEYFHGTTLLHGYQKKNIRTSQRGFFGTMMRIRQDKWSSTILPSFAQLYPMGYSTTNPQDMASLLQAQEDAISQAQQFLAECLSSHSKMQHGR
jgi:hypothetical protein